MKKIVISILGIFMLSWATFAQTTSEVYQLSRTQNLGSARYNGLSGSFGALGGDFTAISENAASSAVFSHSGGSITFGYSNTDYATDYLGTSTNSTYENLDFNQIGAVMVLKNAGDTRGGITKFSLGIAYNKDNDYREQYSFGGNANNTIGDYFVDQAIGSEVPAEELSIGDDESLTSVYSFFANEYGFAGQQALLGFQGFVLDAADDGTYSSAIAGGTNQQIDVSNTGKSDKVTINMAMELDKSIYIGANLNVHSYEYQKSVFYNEINSTSSIREVWFDNTINTFGQGFSAGVGAIAKLGKQLRLGASYNTPTYVYLEDEVFQYLQTTDADGGTTVVDPLVSNFYPQYRLKIPAILTGSAAIVFGKSGLISAQYSRQDFSQISYDYGNSSLDVLESNAINQDIQDTFRIVSTLKIGAELKSKRWSLRGGFSNATSPYKDASVQGETNGYSLGAGYDWGKWKLDFAYGKLVTDFNEALYENASFTNSAAVNRSEQNFTTTLSVNF